MNLPVPGVGAEDGPNYALDLNACLTLLDQHDHSLGRGVQITPAGMNINADLNMNSNNLTQAGEIVFVAQGSNPTTLQSLYVSPGIETPLTEDLWFNDGNGNQVQITSNGLVNATIASLPGESYAGGTFFWVQGAGSTTPANFDIGSITLRPNVAATTFGVTLSPPTGISSQYSINLPLLPLTDSFVRIDNSGVMTTQQYITNTDIQDNTINGSKITDDTLNGAKIVDHTVGLTQLDTTALQWNTQPFTITTPQAFNVRVATTVNGTLGTAFDNGSPVDGVTLATNDIILVKNQTVSTENGVYIVQASGTPVRHANYDTAAELNYAGVHVTAGTVNTNTDWFQNDILTTLADPQSWSRSQTILFTVPANVNQLEVQASGGGAGGGGGSGSAAGGGGGGATPLSTIISVTPGDAVNITVGFKGAGGAAGVAGANGSDTSITTTGVNLLFKGGIGGLAGQTPGNGAGTTYPAPVYDAASVFRSGGGAGTANQPGAPAANMQAVPTMLVPVGAVGGFSGNSPSLGSGGGGGGSGYGIGVVGATGGNSGTPATPTAATNPGAGGGGGAGTISGTAGRGGDGASGKVIIQWLGAP